MSEHQCILHMRLQCQHRFGSLGVVVLAAVVMQSYLADATHCTRIFLTQLAAALSGSRDDEVVLCSSNDKYTNFLA